MTIDTPSSAAPAGPDLRPHPRVPDTNRRMLTDSARILSGAARTAEKPIPDSSVAYDLAVSLATFARCCRNLLASPTAALTADDIEGAHYLTRAVTRLTVASEETPVALAAEECDPIRAAILGLATEVEQSARKHPHRLFLGWFQSATRTAALLCETANRAAHAPAGSTAALDLACALAAPPTAADFSDGYLDTADVAALLMATEAEARRWWRVYPDFPRPAFIDGTQPMWHAERARELRAWWLRHDELPMAQHPAVTPGHRIGDQYLAVAR